MSEINTEETPRDCKALGHDWRYTDTENMRTRLCLVCGESDAYRHLHNIATEETDDE